MHPNDFKKEDRIKEILKLKEISKERVK